MRSGAAAFFLLAVDVAGTSRTMRCDLSGHLLLPGLINAHDHLEFNLFPRLGRGPYANASSWAADIYRPDASPVKEHLLVPKKVRLIWGGIKNLLSGVTTVAHHNPWEASVFAQHFQFACCADMAGRIRSSSVPILWSVTAGRRFAGLSSFTPRKAPATMRAAEVQRLDEMGVLERQDDAGACGRRRISGA